MMYKAVMLTNPPATTREGQQRRGMFPLPLIALADALPQETAITHVSPDLIADYAAAPHIVSSSNVDILVMTCYQETMQSTVALATVAKDTGKKVVLGGHHITLWGGEKTMREIPEADYVIVGEGETPLQLLTKGVHPERIPGLWWREGGIPRTNTLPLYSDDWTHRPPMIRGYSSFDYTALWQRNEKIGRTGYSRPISIIGVRGCAYAQRTGRRCTFCAMPLSTVLRCRSPQYFWEEITWLANRFQVDIIWDHSDSLLGSRAWLAEVAAYRPSHTPPLWCYGRADEINPKTIDSIAAIGIEHIYIGVEVGSKERLQEIKKGITLHQALKAIRLCTQYNIRVQPSFIVGLPGETGDSLRDTLQFARQCGAEGADDIVFHEFILRKGLPWWDALVRKFPEMDRIVVDQGSVQELLWREYNPRLDREDAIHQVREALREFPHSELTAWNI